MSRREQNRGGVGRRRTGHSGRLLVAVSAALILVGAACSSDDGTGAGIAQTIDPGTTDDIDTATTDDVDATGTTGGDVDNTDTTDDVDPTDTTDDPEPSPPVEIAVDTDTFLDVAESISWLTNPHFETDVGGGEGRPVYTVRSVGLLLHPQPLSATDSLGILPLGAGDEVDVIAVRRLNHGLGVYRPVNVTQIGGRNLGPDRFLRNDVYRSSVPEFETVTVNPDDLVLLLAPGPEGTCFLAIAGPADDDFQGLPAAPDGVLGFPGDVFDVVSCPSAVDPDYDELGTEVIEEWLLVAGDDGEPLGWVLAGDGLIEVTDVQF